MELIAFVIVVAGFVIADAIMFVNGYRSLFWKARTKQEKAVRRAFFDKLNIKWDEKQ
jgi:hypothetical protein